MKVNLASPQTACTTSTAYPLYETHEVDTGVTITTLPAITSLIFKGDGTLNGAAQAVFTVCKTGQLGNVITVGLAGRITTDPTAAKCP